MAQYSRPSGDVSTGSWTVTPLWSKIEETPYSDSDFVTSAKNAVNDTFEVSISNVADPSVHTGHTVRYRAYCSKSSNGTIVVSLVQGTTVIRSYDPGYLGTSFGPYSFNLTEAEAANITATGGNYTDLRLRFVGTCSANAYVYVSWCEFEVPNIIFSVSTTVTNSTATSSTTDANIKRNVTTTVSATSQTSNTVDANIVRPLSATINNSTQVSTPTLLSKNLVSTTITNASTTSNIDISITKAFSVAINNTCEVSPASSQISRSLSAALGAITTAVEIDAFNGISVSTLVSGAALSSTINVTRVVVKSTLMSVTTATSTINSSILRVVATSCNFTTGTTTSDLSAVKGFSAILTSQSTTSAIDFFTLFYASTSVGMLSQTAPAVCRVSRLVGASCGLTTQTSSIDVSLGGTLKQVTTTVVLTSSTSSIGLVASMQLFTMSGPATLTSSILLTPEPTIFNVSDAPFTLGRQNGTSNYFNGWLDEVVIFNDCKTLIEIDLIRMGSYHRRLLGTFVESVAVIPAYQLHVAGRRVTSMGTQVGCFYDPDISATSHGMYVAYMPTNRFLVNNFLTDPNCVACYSFEIDPGFTVDHIGGNNLTEYGDVEQVQ